ncbi:MAG: exodeoxyribonuclease V subunit alpha [Propionibacteriaceae bacterium]|nr:exodeoxyribonuclease V subunit alpha [Propionibacteriaceae bacterium]
MTPLDPGQASLAATGALAPSAEAGELTWSDAQIARHIAYLHGEADEAVILALALTLAANRAGSVCLDVRHLPATAGAMGSGTVATERVLRATASGPDTVADPRARSPLVTLGTGPAEGRPLRLVDNLLYLERSWDDQAAVAAAIRRRTTVIPPRSVILSEAKDLSGQEILRSAQDDRGAQAIATARAHSLSVIGGGPGTGKTTTVARLVAALADPAQPPRIALAAPTGKAAARLDTAVRENLAAAGLQALADAIPPAATLHRLLGVKPWGAVDHGPANPLAADLVIVDETSMVSLHHMRLLLDAVPAAARLVLVGDPDQLASVESGAVLADLVARPGAVPFTRLDKNYRFSGALTDLAAAIRTGNADAVLSLLDGGDPAIEFVPADLAQPGAERHLPTLRAAAIAQAEAVRAALTEWEADNDEAALPAALDAADAHRLLCAHRQGPFGVARWHRAVAAWLAQALPGYGHGGPWHPGLPVQVTRNDEVLGVFNGDTGVVVPVRGRPRVALATAAGLRLLGPAELDGLEPIHATTIHKAQGSQFEAVSVIVPEPTAALLTRELLYTAVTRAKTQVRLIGTRAAVAHAVTHPALRASGLAQQLALA